MSHGQTVTEVSVVCEVTLLYMCTPLTVPNQYSWLPNVTPGRQWQQCLWCVKWHCCVRVPPWKCHTRTCHLDVTPGRQWCVPGMVLLPTVPHVTSVKPKDEYEMTTYTSQQQYNWLCKVPQGGDRCVTCLKRTHLYSFNFKQVHAVLTIKTPLHSKCGAACKMQHFHFLWFWLLQNEMLEKM